jgi:hypothetical protein
VKTFQNIPLKFEPHGNLPCFLARSRDPLGEFGATKKKMIYPILQI